MGKRGVLALFCAGMLLLSACSDMAVNKDLAPNAANAVAPLAEVADKTGFFDVASDSWYAEVVEWCQEHDIMNGISATTFSPDNTITRAMLAVVLHRAAGNPSATGTTQFRDVKDGI